MMAHEALSFLKAQKFKSSQMALPCALKIKNRLHFLLNRAPILSIMMKLQNPTDGNVAVNVKTLSQRN